VASSPQKSFMDCMTLKMKARNLEMSVPIHQSMQSSIPEALNAPFHISTKFGKIIMPVVMCSSHDINSHSLADIFHFPIPTPTRC